MKRYKYDTIFVMAVILAAALIWLFSYLTRSEGAYVRVTVNGELYGEYPLNTDTKVNIGGGDSYNILIIQGGEAWIDEASCPDKLCIKQGKIRYDGQSVICLPNKMVAEVIGGKKPEFDAVVK
ncbi:MAG: NusG domain II-containing protein [Clostridiales bacterium]|nr:NusG domain II-containing protein [Clostridiales bacterium]